MREQQTKGPGKTDLFMVLKQLENAESEKLLKLKAVSQAADAALEEFQESNAEYKKTEACLREGE